jgi:hypothetical protein
MGLGREPGEGREVHQRHTGDEQRPDALCAHRERRPRGRVLVHQPLQRQGVLCTDKYDAYALNNVTAKKSQDGSYTIHFGGDPKQPNYLPIMDGWNYIVRLYQPRKEILNGTWKFPTPQPVK